MELFHASLLCLAYLVTYAGLYTHHVNSLIASILPPGYHVIVNILLILLLFTEQAALLVCSGNAITYTNYNNSCSLVLKMSVSTISIKFFGNIFHSFDVLEK